MIVLVKVVVVVVVVVVIISVLVVVAVVVEVVIVVVVVAVTSVEGQSDNPRSALWSARESKHVWDTLHPRLTNQSYTTSSLFFSTFSPNIFLLIQCLAISSPLLYLLSSLLSSRFSVSNCIKPVQLSRPERQYITRCRQKQHKDIYHL